MTYPVLSQYNGQNIPGLVVNSARKTKPWVLLITAKEIGSNKFITYIYTFSNVNTHTLTVLSSKDVTIGTTNGYGFIGYNGFDSTKEHLTTVQVLA